MTKIVLGKKPASFKKRVSFTMLDGSQGFIDCTFKYRTRTEFGAFIDKIMGSAKSAHGADAPDVTAETFSMEKLMSSTAESNGEYLMQVLESWGLDEPLNHSNAQALSNEIPAAAMAIMETYRTAITEGRLGN